MCIVNINKLRSLRKKADLTQDELADLIKVSPDEIGKLERDKIPDPRLSTAIKIADHFDVSLDWLCDRDHICCITKLERTVIRYIQQNIFNVKALEMAISHYDNPTELTSVMREIHIMIPHMDLETAKSTHKLLTSKVEM